MKVKLSVKGMHCRSCEMLINDSLKDLGANSASSSHKSGVVEVDYNIDKLSLDLIKEAIKKAGYDVQED